MDVKKVILAFDYLLSLAERQMDWHATLLSALQRGSNSVYLLRYHAFLCVS